MRKATLFIPDVEGSAKDLCDMILSIESVPISGKMFFDMNVCNAMIIPGGYTEVDAKLYGENNVNPDNLNKNMDEFQYLMIELFINKKRAIYAISRGMRLLNVYFGGSLEQEIDNPEVHSYDIENENYRIHTVKAKEGSWVEEVYGREFKVRSAHNQKIKKLGEHLIADAWAEDGSIEAFHHDQYPIYAVAWYPDMMGAKYASDEYVDGTKEIIYFIDHSFGGYR